MPAVALHALQKIHNATIPENFCLDIYFPFAVIEELIFCCSALQDEDKEGYLKMSVTTQANILDEKHRAEQQSQELRTTRMTFVRILRNRWKIKFLELKLQTISA